MKGGNSDNKMKHWTLYQTHWRANKRGATPPWQRRRADETREHASRDSKAELAKKRAASAPDEDAEATPSCCGVRVSFSLVAAWPCLQALPRCLGVDATTALLTLGSTVTSVPNFIFGTPEQPV